MSNILTLGGEPLTLGGENLTLGSLELIGVEVLVNGRPVSPTLQNDIRVETRLGETSQANISFFGPREDTPPSVRYVDRQVTAQYGDETSNRDLEVLERPVLVGHDIRINIGGQFFFWGTPHKITRRATGRETKNSRLELRCIGFESYILNKRLNAIQAGDVLADGLDSLLDFGGFTEGLDQVTDSPIHQNIREIALDIQRRTGGVLYARFRLNDLGLAEVVFYLYLPDDLPASGRTLNYEPIQKDTMSYQTKLTDQVERVRALYGSFVRTQTFSGAGTHEIGSVPPGEYYDGVANAPGAVIFDRGLRWTGRLIPYDGNPLHQQAWPLYAGGPNGSGNVVLGGFNAAPNTFASLKSAPTVSSAIGGRFRQPSPIVLIPTGTPPVADLGLSRHGDNSETRETITLSGERDEYVSFQPAPHPDRQVPSGSLSFVPELTFPSATNQLLNGSVDSRHNIVPLEQTPFFVGRHGLNSPDWSLSISSSRVTGESGPEDRTQLVLRARTVAVDDTVGQLQVQIRTRVLYRAASYRDSLSSAQFLPRRRTRTWTPGTFIATYQLNSGVGEITNTPAPRTDRTSGSSQAGTYESVAYTDSGVGFFHNNVFFIALRRDERDNSNRPTNDGNFWAFQANADTGVVDGTANPFLISSWWHTVSRLVDVAVAPNGNFYALTEAHTANRAAFGRAPIFTGGTGFIPKSNPIQSNVPRGIATDGNHVWQLEGSSLIAFIANQFVTDPLRNIILPPGGDYYGCDVDGDVMYVYDRSGTGQILAFNLHTREQLEINKIDGVGTDGINLSVSEGHFWIGRANGRSRVQGGLLEITYDITEQGLGELEGGARVPAVGGNTIFGSFNPVLDMQAIIVDTSIPGVNLDTASFESEPEVIRDIISVTTAGAATEYSFNPQDRTITIEDEGEHRVSYSFVREESYGTRVLNAPFGEVGSHRRRPGKNELAVDLRDISDKDEVRRIIKEIYIQRRRPTERIELTTRPLKSDEIFHVGDSLELHQDILTHLGVSDAIPGRWIILEASVKVNRKLLSWRLSLERGGFTPVSSRHWVTQGRA